jgi:hypothetical protein
VVISARPPVINNTIWDWRLGLPALMQATAARINVVGAVYPEFVKNKSARDELLGYRTRLIQVRDKLAGNLACEFSLWRVRYTYTSDFQFELKAICVDPFTGVSSVISKVGRLNVYEACYPCIYTYPGQHVTSYPLDLLWPYLTRSPDFKDIVTNGLEQARAHLRYRLGLFELQGMIDRLYALANNDPGPLFPDGLLPSRGAGNRCALATSEGVVVNACYGTTSRVVSTPTGPQTLTISFPMSSSWSWNPVTGAFKASDGRCLDVQGGGMRPATPVWLWGCNETYAQRWSYDPETHLIRNAGGYVLDVKYANFATGTPLWTWSENFTGAQLWGP